MEENKKPLSLIEKMKQRAQQQKNYGGEYIEEAAKVNARTCPNCGAQKIEFLTTVKDLISLVTFIFGILLSIFPFYTKYKYRCESCKFEF